MPKVSEMVNSLPWLDCEQLRIWRDGDELCMSYGGTVYRRIKPVRLFPLTAKDRMISIFDEAGKEIGIIREIKQLDAKSRAALESELSERYFMPRITKINAIKIEFGMMKWDVETDRGRRQFLVRERNDVQLLLGNRVLIVDADGNPYEIPNYMTLDAQSRALLEEQL
ncbi:MAG: DUF1854 domain-containing protein [Armatimonadota bacterium]|nr:DUF1854 domain-containing protein [Armatimonadota bacterium]MCX7777035.1 DUF1854 domain-containing protein [Armatimonadota bacterium]MDW8024897.1 DUF1854 domain-containing protein [Armatimonadota bacterium]